MSLTDVTDLGMSPSVVDRAGLTPSESLTPIESLALGERLARLSRLIERSMGEALNECGLTRNAWVLLSTMDAEGVGVALPAGEWGARARLSPSSMSAATDLLHRAGWVKRWRDPSNRRSVLVALAPEGAGVAENTRHVMAGAAPGTELGLSGGQLRQLSDLVACLLRAVTPDAADSVG